MSRKQGSYTKLKQEKDDSSTRSDADDDLEYHVTFPQSWKVSDSETEEMSENSDAATVIQKLHQRKPVVLLLGWLGCQDRYLAKYAQIYETSFVTLRVRANCRLFPSQLETRRYAQKLLDILFDYDYDNSPIVIHAFSNFGTIMLLNMVSLINEQRNGEQLASANSRYGKLNVRGVIFDSTPGRPRLMSGYRAIVSNLPVQSSVLRFAMKIGVFCYFLSQVVIRWFSGHFKSLFRRSSKSQDTLLEFYSSLKHHDFMWRNEMYLYSRADALIDWRDVDEVARFRQAKPNMNVSMHCWRDTEHVAHLRKYQDEYTKLCLDFAANM